MGFQGAKPLGGPVRVGMQVGGESYSHKKQCLLGLSQDGGARESTISRSAWEGDDMTRLTLLFLGEIVLVAFRFLAWRQVRIFGLAMESTLVVVLPMIAASACTAREPEDGATNTPTYHLWAWRRREDLSFIEPASVRAAIWTATIFVEDDEMAVERRTVPITYPAGMAIVAVTRLEVGGVYGLDMAKAVAAAIRAEGAPFLPVEYQVDFDARHSQRPFYRLLLSELRGLIGDAELSITALASWCQFDNWIRGLPIDSAVPMVYRLGPQRETVLARLRTERAFREPVCAGNVGYSADEPVVQVAGAERVFLFHPQPWTRERFGAFVNRLEASH